MVQPVMVGDALSTSIPGAALSEIRQPDIRGEALWISMSALSPPSPAYLTVQFSSFDAELPALN